MNEFSETLLKSPPRGAPSELDAATSAAPRYRYTRRRWRLLCAAFDAIGERWARLRKGRAAAPELPQAPRILVIQLDHLGDGVLSTGLLRALKSRWPAGRIELLAGPWNRGLFVSCPEVDRVHVSRWNRFARLGIWGPLVSLAMALRWGWRLRRRKYDLAIDVRGELPHALLMAVAGIPRRLGWNCGGGGFLLTDSPEYVPDRTEVRSRQALLDRLGVEPPPGQAFWPPQVVVQPAARQRIEKRLRAGGVRDGFVVVHPWAGTAAKRWPLEYVRETIGRLVVEDGRRVVLVGSDAERPLARELLGPQVWPGVLDLSGELSVAELAALLEKCQLFIGMDSGPAHLAAAVGAMSLVLFSGTNLLSQWRPIGPRTHVLKHAVSCSPCHHEECPLAGHPCMSGLPASSVVNKARQLLSLGRSPRPASPAVHIPRVASDPCATSGLIRRFDSPAPLAPPMVVPPGEFT